MAFNPFNVFRRNQKVLFAILTIVVMFMFVLSSGLGGGADFFDWLPRWLGAKGGGQRGELLAVIGGSRVYERDLNYLQTKRTLANLYMSEAGARAAENLARYVGEGVGRVSPQDRDVIQQALANRPLYVDQQFLLQVQMGRIPPEQLDEFREQMILFYISRLGQIAENGQQDHDRDIARVMQSLIELDLRLFAGGRRGQYFTNLPNTGENKDLIEFQLWLTKADNLGVTFTDQDVSDLVLNEFFRRLDNDDLRAVEEGLRGRVGYTPPLLREALADEFRVRLAQTAVLGQSIIRPLGQGYDAPYDFYRFYRDQTSTAKFGVISVPAENYLPKVEQETPPDAELREIFRRHRNDEPNPALARPGLKEPRKLKLEWVEATGSEPYYRAAADEGMLKAGVMARAVGFLGQASALGGVTIAGALFGGPAAAAIPDPVLAAGYEEYRTRQERIARDNWYSTPVFDRPQVMDRGFYRPEQAAAVAGAAGPVGEAFEADRQARVPTLAPALIAPVMPGVGVPTVLIATAAAQAVATEPLPLEAVRLPLSLRALTEAARTIAHDDLNRFQEEMARLNVLRPDSLAADQARAQVEKFVRERGLRHGRSEEFRDQFHLADDPGLRPLRERMEQTLTLHGGYINPAEFGGRFFAEMDPLTRQVRPATGLYRPQPYPFAFLTGPTPEESALLVWRIAEQPAEAPRTFEEAREKAAAAWRLQRARELARKDAEELARRTEGLGQSFTEIEQKLRDIRAEFAARFDSPEARERVRYFEIDNVAPVVIQSQDHPLAVMARQQVTPFTLAPSEYVPYPSQQMVEELVRAKDRPPSTSLVLADNPEQRFYVAVVLKHDVRGADDFKEQVYLPRTSFEVARAILPRHQDEMRRQARERAVAMLKAELNYEEKSERVHQRSESAED
jgi:hypothetical protein